MMLIGGVIPRQLARSYASRAGDPQNVALAFRVADPIERYMVIPGSVLVTVFGVILAWISGVPIFGFLQGASTNWLLAAIVLLIVTMFLVPAVFIPRGKVFGRHLAEAVSRGEITPQLRASLNDPVVRLAHLFEIAAILLIVILIVFKPF
ncbi:DUF2269 family protein [bacterium]|nr:MAG: DUF2269 family protein [bacterium]